MQPVLEPAPPYLVRKRESIGLSLREIANSTHIGVPYLEAIEGAFGKTPTSSRKYIRKSLAQIRPELEAHPQAWDEVASAAKLKV